MTEAALEDLSTERKLTRVLVLKKKTALHNAEGIEFQKSPELLFLHKRMCCYNIFGKSVHF